MTIPHISKNNQIKDEHQYYTHSCHLQLLSDQFCKKENVTRDEFCKFCFSNLGFYAVMKISNMT